MKLRQYKSNKNNFDVLAEIMLLVTFNPLFSSTRTSAVNSSKQRRSAVARDEEEEDLTKDMEDPTPEPNIQEVSIPKPSRLSPPPQTQHPGSQHP